MKLHSRKLISILLVVMMIFTSLPMSVLANSFSNMVSQGGYVSSSGNGKAPQGTENILAEPYAYKISVWYAPLNENATKMNGYPIYEWGTAQGTSDQAFQVGKTVYWRRGYIADGYQTFIPSKWNTDNIYHQASRGKITWSNIQNQSFDYFATLFAVECAKNSGNVAEKNKEILDTNIGDIKSRVEYLQNKPSNEWTQGDFELEDFIKRVYNMSNPNEVDINSITPGGLYAVGGGEMMDTVEEFAVPYADGARMKKERKLYKENIEVKKGLVSAGSEGGGPRVNDEYVRSYFLSPFVLGNIAYNTMLDGDTNIYWTVQDFIDGTIDTTIKGVKYKWDKGQYKIFIEPVQIAPTKLTSGKIIWYALSWRDMMVEDIVNKKDSVLTKKAVGLGPVVNGMTLDREDNSLRYKYENGAEILSKETTALTTEEAIQNVGRNRMDNGYGVGVLSSPSLNSYIPEYTDIIKTFVEIVGVNDDGTPIYNTVAETRMGHPGFNVTETGNITNIASVESIEFDGYKGKGILNDIFTTDKELSIDRQNNTTVWENTDLPENIGANLSLNADDIAGYNFGILTNTEVFVNAVIEAKEHSDTLSGDVANKMVQEGLDGAEKSKEVNAAGAAQTTYIGSSFVVKERNAAELSEAEAIVADNINTAGESVDIIFDTPEGEKGFQISRKVDEITVLEAVKYEYYEDIILGQIDYERGEVIRIKEEDKAALGIKTPANTIVLRYIVLPAPKQFNVIEIKDGMGNSKILTCMDALDISGDTANIQMPNHSDLKGYPTPELVDWVTNSEKPTIDISDNTLPTVSKDGLKMSDDSRTIYNYPVDKPITHNLYVKWVIELPPPPPEGEAVGDVPEWRLSKYFAPETEIPTKQASMAFSVITGCCGDYSLTPTGTWNYSVKNPNEEFADSGSQRLHSWLHSKTKKIGSSTISRTKTSAMVDISGSMTAIKSTDTTGLNAAKWVTDSGTVNGLTNYDIKTDYKSTADSKKHYTAKDLLGTDLTLDFGVYNNSTYYNTYAIGHWDEDGNHWHTYSTNTISPGNATYSDGVTKIGLSFNKYNPKDTSSISVTPKLTEENAYTSYSYQTGDVMKVYPEYGMLFDNDSDTESIKWIAGEKAREIKPVTYHTFRFKTYVVPNSTGSSVATDSRALTKKNQVSATAADKNKQVIYKGANVNTAFQLFRDSTKENAALLTVKTFALDYNDSKNVQNAWGMSGYKPETTHANLVNSISGDSAKASEKLFINNDGATYNGGIKQQQTLSVLFNNKLLLS